ncbi:hypothetical protein FB2170_13693 [Maribacter sp. HTCC2170]|nr:hypothetical protein FB2170_13693 [Maribacter sp. HTCC2170]
MTLEREDRKDHLVAGPVFLEIEETSVKVISFS